MQKLKDAASTAALAATTGGAGAAAKVAAQKGLKGALQRGAKKAKDAVGNAKNKANAIDDKLSNTKGVGLGYRGVKGAGKLGLRVGGAMLKAGGQNLLRNAPGAKGFFDGMNEYQQNKESMKTPGQKNAENAQQQAQQRYSNLSDMREGMGALVQQLQGHDAAEAFKRDFDDKFQFHPKDPDDK